VDLLGKFNGYAPLEITGKVNPFGANLLVDLKVDFKDMDLAPLNPYATRYIGYKIEKGKVAFNLKCEVVKRTLNAQNNILFDQLTLGEKVESPQAVKLPVKFAISLLKNRKGEINQRQTAFLSWSPGRWFPRRKKTCPKAAWILRSSGLPLKGSSGDAPP